MSFFVNNVELNEATFNQQEVKSIYFNTHLIWEAFSGPESWPAAGTPLKDWTWEEIINLCNSGRDVRRYFSIGDTRSLVLTTGEVVTVAIGDFYHNTISQTNKTAAIAFTFVNCLNTKYAMNTSQTNKGGWNDSNMRKTHMPNILATFPAELTANNAIKNVGVVATVGSINALLTSYDRLRLHSVTELGGSAPNAAIEGTAYPYYSESPNNTTKYVNGKSVNYWTRTSCRKDEKSFYASFYDMTNYYYDYTADYNFSVACAFDI